MSDNFEILDANVDGLVHRFIVALDCKKVDALVTGRLSYLQKTTQIKGFRTGKAPLRVIRRYYGAKITNTVIDGLAIDVARNLIVGNQLRPVGRPIIEIIDDDTRNEEQVRFTLTLEVIPRVALKPLDRLRIVRYRVNNATDHRLQKLSWQHVKRQIFDQLMVCYDFALPSAMVKREHQRITQSYRETIEDRISADLNAEFHDIAARRIRLAILLSEIGRQHHILIPREEVEVLVETQAQLDSEHGTNIVNYYVENPTALAELHSSLFEDRVVDFILKQAVVDERAVTVRELMTLSSEGKMASTQS